MSSPLGDVEEAAAVRAPAGQIRRLIQFVLLAVPVVLVVVGGWQKRAIVDDGFINFRVVDQMWAGNGPVFNAGQRVEAYSSPAWLTVLVVGRALFGSFASLSQVAVYSGIACMAAAVVLSEIGAVRLSELVATTATEDADSSVAVPDREWLVPIGALVFAALPPTWHWATSGLDTALCALWIAGSFWALVSVGRRRSAGLPVSTWRWCAVAALVGSGWLVRPDAAVLSVAFLAALVVWDPSWRRRMIGLMAGLGPSMLYQLFRMGYFAALVPNTALAKDPGQSTWGPGWNYLTELLTPYALWPVLAAVGFFVAWQLLPLRHLPDACRSLRRRTVMTALAPICGGLVHGVWVVRSGGDFMHARLLVPTMMALIGPAAVVRLASAPRGRGWVSRPALVLAAWVLTGAVVVWSSTMVVTHGTWRPDFPYQEPPYVVLGIDNNSAEPDDYPLLAAPGYELRLRAERGDNLLVDGFTRSAPVATDPRWGTVGYFTGIGVVSVVAGTEVWVIDAHGLADPVAARLPPVNQRAGHQRFMPFSIPAARFSDAEPPPSSEAAAIRRGLGCGEAGELRRAIEEELTAGRFVENVFASPSLTRLTIPADGFEMERTFCS